MSNTVDFQTVSTHGKPEKSLGFLLWSTSTTWRSSIAEVLKPLDLTHPQFVVLATLGWLTREGERVTQVMVGKMASLDPNTTSQIMRGLEQKKLIIREVSSDGRVKNPVLTSKGAKLVEKALPIVESADNKFFDSISKAEKDALLKIFRKLS